MSLQEKIVWLLLAICTVAAAIYFGSYGYAFLNGDVDKGYLGWLLTAIIVVTVIVAAVGSGILAVRNQPDADRGPDERDRMFGDKATARGYFIILPGCMALAACLWFGWASAFTVSNGLLLLVVAAEIGRFAYGLYLYRAE